MKKQILPLVAFLLISAMALGQTTKRALVVAIGKYDHQKTGWTVINVDNDVTLIQETLQKQDFLPVNIKVLKNEAATREAIIKALDELEQSSKEGDIVVVHFSSHGQ